MIVVTGATGFVGRRLMRVLVSNYADEEILCLVHDQAENELERSGRAVLDELGCAIYPWNWYPVRDWSTSRNRRDWFSIWHPIQIRGLPTTVSTTLVRVVWLRLCSLWARKSLRGRPTGDGETAAARPLRCRPAPRWKAARLELCLRSCFFPEGAKLVAGEIPDEHHTGCRELHQKIVQPQGLDAHRHDERIQAKADQRHAEEFKQRLPVWERAVEDLTAAQGVVHQRAADKTNKRIQNCIGSRELDEAKQNQVMRGRAKDARAGKAQELVRPGDWRAALRQELLHLFLPEF